MGQITSRKRHFAANFATRPLRQNGGPLHGFCQQVSLREICAKNPFCDIARGEAFSPRLKPLSRGAMSQNGPPFVDVLIAKHGYDDLPELLEEIVQNDPEALYIYLTDMPIEQLDYCKQNLSSSELISIMDADCTIEVLLYENALLVSYKTELYDSSMVKQHIEEILLG